MYFFSFTSQSNESIPSHQPYKNHNEIEDTFEVVWNHTEGVQTWVTERDACLNWDSEEWVGTG